MMRGFFVLVMNLCFGICCTAQNFQLEFANFSIEASHSTFFNIEVGRGSNKHYLIISGIGMYEKGHATVSIFKYDSTNTLIYGNSYGIYTVNDSQGLNASFSLPEGTNEQILTTYLDGHIQKIGKVPEIIKNRVLTEKTHKYIFKIESSDFVTVDDFLDSLSNTKPTREYSRDITMSKDDFYPSYYSFSNEFWVNLSKVLLLAGVERYIPFDPFSDPDPTNGIFYYPAQIFPSWLRHNIINTRNKTLNLNEDFLNFDELSKADIDSFLTLGVDSMLLKFSDHAKIYFGGYHIFKLQSYTGQVKNDLPNGRGVLTFKKKTWEGVLYIDGSFINGIPEGLCSVYRKDSTLIRRGFFKDGRLNGDGIYYDREGDPRLKSFFKNDVPINQSLKYIYSKFPEIDQKQLNFTTLCNLIGTQEICEDTIYFPRFRLSLDKDTAWFAGDWGHMKFKNGDKMVGHAKEGVGGVWFEGKCYAVSKDGSITEGNFDRNIGWLNGPGRISLANGQVHDGTWENSAFTYFVKVERKKKWHEAIGDELEKLVKDPIEWFDDRIAEEIIKAINHIGEFVEEETGATIGNVSVNVDLIPSVDDYTSDDYFFSVPPEELELSFDESENFFGIIKPATPEGIRGKDGYGSGAWGAARKNKDGTKRFHRGTDWIIEPNDEVLSPVSGTVTKIGISYDEFKYVEISSNNIEIGHFKCRIHYLKQTVKENQFIRIGDNLGKALDLQKRYPPTSNGKMTNHIHVEFMRKVKGKWIYFDPYKGQ